MHWTLCGFVQNSCIRISLEYNVLSLFRTKVLNFEAIETLYPFQFTFFHNMSIDHRLLNISMS